MTWEETKAQLRLAYDRAAEERDRHEKESWKLRERQDFLHRLLAVDTRQLLELGTGTGEDALFFQAAGIDVTGVDLSSEMVRISRGKGLHVQELDFTTVAEHFSPASFDGAYSINALLHVPKERWDMILTGVQAVVGPNGLLCLGVYGGVDRDGIWLDDHYLPPRHFTFHTDDALVERLSRFFDVVDFHTVDYGHALLHFQAATLRIRVGS